MSRNCDIWHDKDNDVRKKDSAGAWIDASGYPINTSDFNFSLRSEASWGSDTTNLWIFYRGSRHTRITLNI